jgi:hypothetical protein
MYPPKRPIWHALPLAICLALIALPANAALFQRHSDGSFNIDPLLCMTDYQVRQAVARQGFTHIFLNAPIETQIQVKATKGKTVYLIDLNRCGGEIDGVQRLGPAT